jgi:molecular chaperone HtpG
MVTEEKGSISIHTENIFPIIKKFLYSDHEIFLRELVSNAVDATQKLKKLSSLGEFTGELGELKVEVSFDKEAKTITVKDNGLGMTADEIKKYINQIAFSGAAEFLEKYKGEEDAKQQIIGHFGLGFYSSFMVAAKVEIITKSHQDAPAARWICDGSTEFEISGADRTERGTDIILHIAEDSEEFLEKYRLEGILNKYCKFMPVDIFFDEKQINNPTPIWTKSPNELKDEDYLNFYKELYPYGADPLFWIHLNVDYPFNLTGILYFPKVGNDFEVKKDKIQLYSRQVFITDEVKDVVPDFLMLLHGVIDSPDIPLNVSRSFLQADANVKKINQYVTRKVADKLNELFNQDRAAYEEKWNSLHVFVKYGMISETKFAEKAKDFTLLKNQEGKYFTLNEYSEKVKDNQTDKNGSTIWLYTSNPEEQEVYCQSAIKKGYDVLTFDHMIDPHFIGHLEMSVEKTQLKRVDADGINKLIEKDEPELDLLTEDQKSKLKTIFEQATGQKSEQLSVEPLSTDSLPVLITEAEFMRRMKEMSQSNGMGAAWGDMPGSQKVVLNANHASIAKILETEDAEKQQTLARYAYDLALLSNNKLKGKDLAAFIERSLSLLN